MCDVADLSQYGLGSANNGGGSVGVEFTFPAGTLEAGEFVYVTASAAPFEEFFGFAAEHVSSAVSVNGDDAIELFEGNRVIGGANVSATGGGVWGRWLPRDRPCSRRSPSGPRSPGTSPRRTAGSEGCGRRWRRCPWGTRRSGRRAGHSVLGAPR